MFLGGYVSSDRNKVRIRRQPIPFAIVGPSGVGKATILSRVLKEAPGLGLVKSLTSRPPRRDDGTLAKYTYVTPAEFESLIEEDAFFEWAEVHGHYYGTPKSAFAQPPDSGKDLLLEIDVQGARGLKAVRPDAVLIFIAPPNFQALRDRLRSRSSEPESEILTRLGDAKTELPQAKDFNYLVVNDRLDEAVEAVKSIISSERLKAERVIQERGEDFLE